MSQNAAPVLSDGRRAGPQHEKGVVGKIADQTGLSKDTVRRALNPEVAATQKAEREAARNKRQDEQAEHDRLRDEHRAKLPASIQAGEAARQENRQKAREQTSADADAALDLDAADRIAELEEEVRVLEADNVALKAENALYGDMKASWQQGDWPKVVADREEQIRVLREQFHTENEEKVREQRRAKKWEKILREKYRHFDETVIDPATRSPVRG